MKKNVIDTDLTGKVAVVTGAGGVLCSAFAKDLARAGAKVALLDLNQEAAQKFADEIVAEGGVAKAYACNVLDKDICYAVADQVEADLGKCDILINGAGGNNPRATTDKEYYEEGDMDADTKSFFDLDKSGVEFVFNLNFIGTLLPTQAFARQMVGREGCNILNISSMNAYTPLTKIPAYSGAKAAISNFTQWLAVHFSKAGIRVNAIAPGFFSTQQNAKLLYRRHPHRPHRQDPGRHSHGPLRRHREGALRRRPLPPQQRGRQLHHRRVHPHRRRLLRLFRRVTPHPFFPPTPVCESRRASFLLRWGSFGFCLEIVSIFSAVR